MADVINRTTKQILRSVHTPDYPVADWIQNPPLPEGVASRYMVIEGDDVREMTSGEKGAVNRRDVEVIRALKVAELDAALLVKLREADDRWPAIRDATTLGELDDIEIG